MQYNYAWVTITGKVYVDTLDVAQKMEEEGVSEEVAFKLCAEEEIRQKGVSVKSDNPVKVNEIEIDMKTYKSAMPFNTFEKKIEAATVSTEGESTCDCCGTPSLNEICSDCNEASKDAADLQRYLQRT
jgi:hypothetical protein